MIVRRFFGVPTSEWRSPFGELERMGREMAKVFEDFSRTWQGEPPTGVFPLTNITEDNDKLYFRSELPGIKAGDVDISVTPNSISVAGERKIPAEDAKVRYHRREREAGTFRRMIKLPVTIDVSKVEAKSSNGVLTVVMPKAEAAKPKQISIKVS
ncbi:MAG TPA: Hsp20/alpha crystallin family protein [Thermodesulfobacteriota bacterium]|nr:Hsp20/alpha crystallin family protein [Thermodesulfobacteriota bacterium]